VLVGILFAVTDGDGSTLQGMQLKQALDEKDQQIKILQHQLVRESFLNVKLLS